MSNLWRWVVGIAVIAGLAALIIIAAPRQSNVPAELTNKITVAATIFPVADIARQIGGDAVEVVTIISPGVSEHSAAIAPQQIQALQQAQVIFQIGHGIDDQLTQRLGHSLPPIRLVTVDQGIALREFNVSEHAAEEHEDEAEAEHHYDTGTDPHYWLTVPNGIRIAAAIAETLKAIDPDHAATYEANLARYSDTLRALDQELRTVAAAVPRKEFIAMHNAWSYFAAEYGLRLVATYEPVEGQQPSATDLQELHDIITRYQITTFYAEPQKASSSVARFMKREFGVTTRVLDPVGGAAETSSYIDLMRANMAAIAADE